MHADTASKGCGQRYSVKVKKRGRGKEKRRVTQREFRSRPPAIGRQSKSPRRRPYQRAEHQTCLAEAGGQVWRHLPGSTRTSRSRSRCIRCRSCRGCSHRDRTGPGGSGRTLAGRILAEGREVNQSAKKRRERRGDSPFGRKPSRSRFWRFLPWASNPSLPRAYCPSARYPLRSSPVAQAVGENDVSSGILFARDRNGQSREMISPS